MSLPLFGDSGRAQRKGREICSLPCRISSRVGARVALQHGPILRTSAAILTQSYNFFLSGGRFFDVKINLCNPQVVGFLMLKW